MCGGFASGSCGGCRPAVRRLLAAAASFTTISGEERKAAKNDDEAEEDLFIRSLYENQALHLTSFRKGTGLISTFTSPIKGTVTLLFIRDTPPPHRFQGYVHH